jgi:hypothetical protein
MPKAFFDIQPQSHPDFPAPDSSQKQPNSRLVAPTSSASWVQYSRLKTTSESMPRKPMSLKLLNSVSSGATPSPGEYTMRVGDFLAIRPGRVVVDVEHLHRRSVEQSQARVVRSAFVEVIAGISQMG